MGFKNRDFDKPIYIEEEIEPEKVIIISCEGRNTEPEYFEAIKEKLSDFISVLVEIKIVPARFITDKLPELKSPDSFFGQHFVVLMSVVN